MSGTLVPTMNNYTSPPVGKTAMITSKFPHELINKGANSESCVISRHYAYLLMISRVFGMAPLRFEADGTGYRISLSIPMSIYSYILAVSLALMILFTQAINVINYYSDLNVDTVTSQKSKPLFDSVIIAITIILAVFGGRKCMKTTFKFINTMSVINDVMVNTMGTQYFIEKERKIFIILATALAFITGMIIYGLYSIILYTQNLAEQAVINIYYISLFTSWYGLKVFELQFAFTAALVWLRFQAINEILNNTNEKLSIPLPAFTDQTRITAVGDTIYNISCIRNSLNEVVDKIESCYGLPILAVLVSILGDIILSPYLVLLQLNAPPVDIVELIEVVSWFAASVLQLFLLVVPCNNTVRECKKTEDLASRIILTAPSREPLLTRLETFCHQLMLQSPCYQPMGMCTLNGSLIVTIFGAFISYLVILVQFQILT